MTPPTPTSADARSDAPRGALWLIVAAPAIWLVAFVLVYVVVAIGCARSPADSPSIGPARTVALVLAVIGTMAIGGVGLAGWRRIPGKGRDPDDGARLRERFVGWSTLLLSGLSALAMIYLGLTLTLLGSCQ